MFFKISGLLFAIVVVHGDHDGTEHNTLSYSIDTRWNGEAIDHKPVTVQLANSNGDLHLTVTAPFFNSPINKDPLVPDTCPQRSFFTLWDYEVVEAFFLNDDNEYLEIEVSPTGRYLVLLLDGVRNTVLWNLPLFPTGFTLDNPCLPDQSNCDQLWTATTTIPRDYIPANVTRFNAFAIHGRNSGEERPAADDIVYEALYPVDPNVVENPNFHYLEAFKKIDLNEIGLGDVYEQSNLWQQATNQKDYEFTYEVEKKTDCTAAPEAYSAVVKTYKSSESNRTTIQIQVTDTSGSMPLIPNPLQSRDGILTTSTQENTESVWVTFSGKGKGEDAQLEQLRIGINPYGANHYELIANGVILASKNNNLTDVRCISVNLYAYWSCTFNIRWELFPKYVENFQIVHVHKNLVAPEGEEAEEFYGTLCPGNPDQSQPGVVDWIGCQTDERLVRNKVEEPKHSPIWQKALKTDE